MRQGRRLEAIQLLRRQTAVEEFPTRWTAWVRLAEACLALADEAGARSTLERALELLPRDAHLTRALARLPR